MTTAPKIAARAVLALAAAAAGCGAKALQPDGGVGGVGGVGTISTGASGATGSAGTIGSVGSGGAIGSGGATGAGGSTDAGPGLDALLTGQRSFAVTSRLTGVDGVGLVNVPSHSFTMIVDGDHLTAIIGGTGEGRRVTLLLLASGNGFAVVSPPPFSVPSSGCYAMITYSDLAFMFDSGGLLVGRGRGELTTGVTDVATSVSVTMSLTGVDDTVSPALSVPAAVTPMDPFAAFAVVSSEPLPTMQTTQPLLRAAGGDTVVLTPHGDLDGNFVNAFLKPSVVLRFGEQYRVDMTGVRDFAGNPAVARDINGLVFTTAPVPPLVAADGFESVTTATLGGAQVLSGTGTPIISGSRSLYIPPVASGVGSGPATQLALRLAVTPGSTTVRFSYRYVNQDSGTSTYFTVGSVGGSYRNFAPPLNLNVMTSATIGTTLVMLGPLDTAVNPLPADAAGEIVLERVAQIESSSCGPRRPIPGIIIDDLRTE